MYTVAASVGTIPPGYEGKQFYYELLSSRVEVFPVCLCLSVAVCVPLWLSVCLCVCYGESSGVLSSSQPDSLLYVLSFRFPRAVYA